MLFDNRVSSLDDVDVERLVDIRSVVLVFYRNPCKRHQAVEPGNERRIQLDCRNVCRHGSHQVVEQSSLQRKDFLLSAEDFLLIFLQLLSDVAFGVDKSLLPNPFRRHLVLVRVAHLDVVSEHVVVSHLQAWDTRQLALTLLYFQQIVLS